MASTTVYPYLILAVWENSRRNRLINDGQIKVDEKRLFERAHIAMRPLWTQNAALVLPSGSISRRAGGGGTYRIVSGVNGLASRQQGNRRGVSAVVLKRSQLQLSDSYDGCPSASGIGGQVISAEIYNPITPAILDPASGCQDGIAHRYGLADAGVNAI